MSSGWLCCWLCTPCACVCGDRVVVVRRGNGRGGGGGGGGRDGGGGGMIGVRGHHIVEREEQGVWALMRLCEDAIHAP